MIFYISPLVHEKHFSGSRVRLSKVRIVLIF